AGAEAGVRIAFTTDAFVVKPPVFPGGDIGRLAVCGTVNDLVAKGAVPLAMLASFILEEGLDLDLLETVAGSMRRAADEALTSIVAGDTKVVERGGADGLFISTAGLGLIRPGLDVGGANARPGDAVLVTGTVGDHGTAVMNVREGLGLEGELSSDVAPLAALFLALVDLDLPLHVMRDPTRGGLATTVNEIAEASRVGIVLEELAIPVRRPVKTACALLGLDPLYVANEGKLVIVLPEAHAARALDRLRAHPSGREAALIGRVVDAPTGVTLRTSIGGLRPLMMLEGDQLPRIC
ncbi:MAG: hydrogenase expression/formation protein HypE, partial [Candidatus Riflebacteria bacterium]|nr:hydrogenase expression/formation protein HypE [Candidatus Riflebacteria bacterium]